MQWLNQPQKFCTSPTGLQMTAEPDTDFWRVTHYGFIRDNGHLYHTKKKGILKLASRMNNEHWIKTGIEYVDEMQNVSAVVTHKTSDWSVVSVNQSNTHDSIWLKLLRKDDYVEIKYSFDGQLFQLLRLASFEPAVEVMIGMYGAAPGKLPFDVTFEEFKVVSV
uniref:DUF1349 domain-containing protein n=1 Tax=Ditylenchus dipsaci TaxID=166011 RepID=A0A915E3U2_9BILA